MYPDSLLFIILPVGLYIGLAVVPGPRGAKAAGIASAAAGVFLLGAIAVGDGGGTSFDAAFDEIFGVAFGAAVLGAALGALAYHRIVRGRAPSWLWRAVGFAIALAVGVALFVALAVALDL